MQTQTSATKKSCKQAKPMVPASTSRNTKQRTLVLNTVRSMHNHPTAAEIYEEVRQGHPNISRATVYRNLGVLASRGDVLHIEVAGGADRYDFRLDNHAHAICANCGAVYDVELAGERPVIDEVTDAHGFQLQGYALTFTGLCPNCAQA